MTDHKVEVIFIIIQEIKQVMGCGAVCGSESGVVETFKEAHSQFIILFKQITPNLYLYPVKSIAKFTKEMQLNPYRFQLILTDKLQPSQIITMGVMEKWKLVLFGMDCDRVSYVNCLGYPERSLKIKSNPEKQPSDEPSTDGLAAGADSFQKVEVLQHKAFAQIEKDIERTFPGIEFQKKSFVSILKRITNHFPTMGYTQGINFIVGYLLIIGFSESDAFWFFIHLAVNRRYLLLGLYQDGFPLINVYTCIFRKVLLRMKPRLYKHLYQNIVMFQESAWVFKWFMTCFLSSFPLEMCQFAWDMLISKGGIALVNFAISLVTKLQPQLLQLEDACDISEFFSSLKDLSTFNSYFSIKDVVKRAYQVRVQADDLCDLKQVKTQRGGNNFYAQYILFKYEEDCKQLCQTPRLERTQLTKASQQLHQTSPILFKKQSMSKSAEILDKWYEKLTKERIQFIIKPMRKSSHNSHSRSDSLIIALDTVPRINTQQNLPGILERSKETQQSVSVNNFQEVIRFDSEVVQASNRKEQTETEEDNGSDLNKIRESLQVSPNKKNSNRYSSKKSKKQDIVWKDDDEEQEIEQTKDKITRLQDQFLYISRDIRFKRKNITYKSQDTLTQFIKKSPKPKQINNNYIPKTMQARIEQQPSILPNIQIQAATVANQNHSRLARVGNAVLSNMSISNTSNKSSTSSYRTNHKDKDKDNPSASHVSARYCKCMKNKTEENNLDAISKITSRNKVQRVNQPEENLECEQSADFGITRKRMNTYNDWMANSQGPRERQRERQAKELGNLASSIVKQPSEIGSEVEIVQGREMFKKKNRIAGRQGEIEIVNECNHHVHVVQNEISECQSRVVPTPNLDQESIESFIIANVSSRRSDLAQIESVK